MRTIELFINVNDDLHELLIAELLDLDFSGFTQEDHVLKAYIPANLWDETRREQIEEWLAAAGCPPVFRESVYEPQNWNATWEETIKPITVGRFHIRPTWAAESEPPEGLFLLEIDPKMSFGTGYHESTRLVLRLLPDFVSDGMRVLDVGTGTGILAIAALKLGAASAVACDTDEWAQQNCVENFYLNGVAGSASFRNGSLEAVPESGFDLVLANIERNILLDLMPQFQQKTAPGGYLVLAGLLIADREIMLQSVERHDFDCVAYQAENDWWAVVIRKHERPA